MFGIDNAIVASGIGVAGDVAGSFLNERFAIKNQHQAQDFSEKMYRNRYQMQVEDLKKAGLNPMLAYGQGPGSSPTSSAASAHESSTGSRGASTYNDTRLASAQEVSITAQAAKTMQDTRVGVAQEKNIQADTLGKLKIPDVLASEILHNTSSAHQADAATHKIRAEIPKVQSEIDSLKQQIKKQKSDVRLNDALVKAQDYLNGLRKSEEFLNDARIRNTALEGDILKPKAKAAGYHTAEYGHIADNIGKIGSAAWKYAFPTIGQP